MRGYFRDPSFNGFERGEHRSHPQQDEENEKGVDETAEHLFAGVKDAGADVNGDENAEEGDVIDQPDGDKLAQTGQDAEDQAGVDKHLIRLHLFLGMIMCYVYPQL